VPPALTSGDWFLQAAVGLTFLAVFHLGHGLLRGHRPHFARLVITLLAVPLTLLIFRLSGLPDFVVSDVLSWGPGEVGSLRLPNLADRCRELAWSCALAATPALALLGFARLAAGRVRPRPARRHGLSHGLALAVALMIGVLFTPADLALLPAGVALGVGVAGWLAADTLVLGRAWRNGRLCAAAAALSWFIVLVCAVGGLLAWRVERILRLLVEHPHAYQLWRDGLDAGAPFTLAALALALPVLVVALRSLVRIGLRPLPLLALGLALAVVPILGAGLLGSGAFEMLDLVTSAWPYPGGCPA